MVGVLYSGDSNLVHSVNLNDLQVFVRSSVRNKPRKYPRQVVKREIQNLKNLANQKNASAQFRLGMMYYEGRGVIQNFEMAAHWFKQAAMQGLDEAQFILGLMYKKEDQGVTKNFEIAAHWFKQAAEQVHVEAQNNLGLLYYEGKGVTQNFEIAAHWFKQAAEQGLAVAQSNLGGMYYEGKGVTKNFEKTFNWYKQAAMQGYEKAVDWFKQAAMQGHVEAQTVLMNLKKQEL